MAEMINTEPVTCTYRASEWHGLMRDIVYAATTTEAFVNDLVTNADRRRDAWVIASAQRLQNVVQVLDAAAELLATVQARPVPPR